MGHDHLIGDTGSDIRNGDIGFDYARHDTALTGVVVDLTNPASNTDEAAGSYLSVEGLVGSDFNDTLFGDNIADDLDVITLSNGASIDQNDFLFV